MWNRLGIRRDHIKMVKWLCLGVLIVGLSVAFGCGPRPQPDSEAEGYVGSLLNRFVPRELIVWFHESTSEPDMETVIAANGCTILFHLPGDEYYLVLTPLGYSLMEKISDFEDKTFRFMAGL